MMRKKVQRKHWIFGYIPFIELANNILFCSIFKKNVLSLRILFVLASAFPAIQRPHKTTINQVGNGQTERVIPYDKRL